MSTATAEAPAPIKRPTARRRPDFTRDVAAELEAARVLREQIATLAGDDEDFIRDTLEGETDLDALVASVVASIGEDEGHLKGLKHYQQGLGYRADDYARRIDFKRTLLVSALEIAGRPTINTPTGTVSTRPVPPKALVTEEADLPAEFWEPQKPRINSKALLSALKEGRAIPGASLSNGGQTISIRRA